jgi:hypothetical protein
MKRALTITDTLGLWLAISFVAGMCLNQASWGDPNGFHGTGWPFPIVCWDRHSETGAFMDFIAHPLVWALNPLAIFVAGTAMILAAWWALAWFQRFRKRKFPSDTSS